MKHRFPAAIAAAIAALATATAALATATAALATATSVTATLVLVSVSSLAAAQSETAPPARGDPAAGDREHARTSVRQAVVDRMLQMANVSARDFLVDFGAGDGRIAITAAKQHRARALGIECDPGSVALAKKNAAREGVGARARFVQCDSPAADMRRATVVTSGLRREQNLRLRQTLLVMKPGTRVATHGFDMGDWLPDETATVEGRKAYFWIVPARVDGEWRVRAGGKSYDLSLRQKFQKLEGVMVIGADRTGLSEPVLRGSDIRFFVNGRGGVRYELSGKVRARGIDGKMRVTGERDVAFQARRKPDTAEKRPSNAR